jgi:hypothetical protein
MAQFGRGFPYQSFAGLNTGLPGAPPPQQSWEYWGTTNAQSNGTTTLTVNVPGPVRASGESGYLFIIVINSDGSGIAATLPAGWTTDFSGSLSVNASRTYTAGHRIVPAGSSEPASYNITLNATTDVADAVMYGVAGGNGNAVTAYQNIYTGSSDITAVPPATGAIANPSDLTVYGTGGFNLAGANIQTIGLPSGLYNLGSSSNTNLGDVIGLGWREGEALTSSNTFTVADPGTPANAGILYSSFLWDVPWGSPPVPLPGGTTQPEASLPHQRLAIQRNRARVICVAGQPSHGPSGTVQPQPTRQPRRTGARGVTRQAIGQSAFGPAGQVQPETTRQPPRRKTARSVTLSVTGQSAFGPAGQVQPLTVRQPRRTSARAWIAHSLVDAGEGTTTDVPTTLIQPRSTIAIPRRYPSRAVVHSNPGMLPLGVAIDNGSIHRRTSARGVVRVVTGQSAFGPAGTTQSLTTRQPRRASARVVWRRVTGYNAIGIEIQPQPTRQPRRTSARAVVHFIPVTTTNNTGIVPVAGMVQPLATRQPPRRTSARAVWRGITTSLLPNGTVQPVTAQPHQRDIRQRNRALIKYSAFFEEEPGTEVAQIQPVITMHRTGGTAIAPANNMLTNPGFESGSTTPWSLTSGGSSALTISTSPVHSGNYSCQLTMGTSGICYPVQSNFGYTVIGRQYTASIWVYATASGYALAFDPQVNNVNYISGAQNITTLNQWVQYSYTWVANGTSFTNFGFLFNGPNNGTALTIDDASISLTTPVNQAWIGGTGVSWRVPQQVHRAVWHSNPGQRALGTATVGGSIHRRASARAWIAHSPVDSGEGVTTDVEPGQIQPLATRQPRRTSSRAFIRRGTGFGTPYTATGGLVKRRASARAVTRFGPGQLPLGVAVVSGSIHRRTSARGYIRFTPVRTINVQPGSVQPLATRQPRRTSARGVTRFVIGQPSHGPSGTVQPETTRQPPRRKSARGVWHSGPGTMPLGKATVSGNIHRRALARGFSRSVLGTANPGITVTSTAYTYWNVTASVSSVPVLVQWNVAGPGPGGSQYLPVPNVISMQPVEAQMAPENVTSTQPVQRKMAPENQTLAQDE